MRMLIWMIGNVLRDRLRIIASTIIIGCCHGEHDGRTG